MPERWFYAGMVVAILVAAAIGFVPGLLDAESRRGPVTPLVAVHALAVTAWLLLFLTQASLVATHRTRLHRKLGVAGGVLAAVVVVSSYLTTVEMARRGHRLVEGIDTTDMARHLALPFGDLASFAVLTAAALWFRRSPPVHKRLMLLGSIGGFVPASLAHFIGHFQLPTAALIVPLLGFLLAPAVHDRLSTGRMHRVSWAGAWGLFVWMSLELALGGTAAWRGLAEWLIA